MLKEAFCESLKIIFLKGHHTGISESKVKNWGIMFSSLNEATVVFTNKRSQAKVYKMYFGISSV